MDHTRLFMVGVILLLLGVQFRLVESFELNEMATRIVDKRFPSSSSSPSTTGYTSQSAYSDPLLGPSPSVSSGTRHISHPRQLSFAFISVGAILVLTSPVYKK